MLALIEKLFYRWYKARNHFFSVFTFIKYCLHLKTIPRVPGGFLNIACINVHNNAQSVVNQTNRS